jgi:hypothetical protein
MTHCRSHRHVDLRAMDCDLLTKILGPDLPGSTGELWNRFDAI